MQQSNEAPLVVFEAPSLRRNHRVQTMQRILAGRMAVPAVIILGIVVIAAIFAEVLSPGSPSEIDVQSRLADPSADHLLGTDQLGRDTLTRVIYGSRVSLQVGFVAVGIALLLGVPLGLIAGFWPGIVDEVIMRCLDAVIAFPAILLALAIVAVMGSGVINVMIAIGIVYVPTFARLVRAQALSLRQQDFVTAARSIGANDFRIIFRHIWPNATAPIIVQASLAIGYSILAEASLSYLGIGVEPPTATWGGMLRDGFQAIYTSSWLAIFPGVAIFLTVLAVNFLGDAVRDALDPRLRQTFKT